MSVTNGLSTIANLLTDSILIVPPYQRAYAWDPEYVFERGFPTPRQGPNAPGGEIDYMVTPFFEEGCPIESASVKQ